MHLQLIIFLAMVLVFIVSCFALKLPVSISMVFAAVVGALVGGEGIPIRHLIEGTFGYLDTILVIATAMIFMKFIQKSGALNALSSTIIVKFHKKPVLLLILMMFIVMFPGMITGSSTAAVLSAGGLVAPVLVALGVPMVETAAIIAIGGLLGMVAPPVNIPVMIIGGGVDMPYSGFGLPLLLLTLPLAIFSVVYIGRKHIKEVNLEELKKKINIDDTYGIIVYLPIVVLVTLMVVNKIVPNLIPNLGLPLIFLLSSITALFTGKKFNILKASMEAVNDALPVLGILMGVGMFIQIMTLTGARGYVVVSCLSLPTILLYLSIAVTIPLFGAVSSFGAASVLGVPFLLALISKNQIVTAAALSLIAALGDLMPPTALAGLFAAKIVGVENYVSVLKKCLVPAIVIVVYGILFIVFSKPIASILL